VAEAVPAGSERELHGGGGLDLRPGTTTFFAGTMSMPDDRQAVIDVQNAIKKRGC